MEENKESEQRRRLNEKLRRELGEIICKALDDPDVVEVMLNPDGKIWEDRHGHGMKEIGSMTLTRGLNLVGTIAGMLGTVATELKPVVEGELPLDGSRFEGIIPPIVEQPTFAIRKKSLKIFTFDDYVRDGVMTPEQRSIIDHHIQQRHNILVVGGTTSGKTTFCNAVLSRIAELDPDTRIAIIEDTRELQCPAVNKFPLRTSDNVDMTQLLRACMRLRPDRIVVGEVRDKSVLALLKAWNTGHNGGVATVHANDAMSGLTRVEQLIEEGNLRPIPAVIAEAINCIVSIQRTKTGRKIQQIVVVKSGGVGGYETETY